MQDTYFSRCGRALGIGCAVLAGAMAFAYGTAEAASEKENGHVHEAHKSDDIYRGYFDDSQIEARTLADWEGDWQSVYPYLVDRSLDPVLAHKAENGDKTIEEYRAYYQSGYKTDVERIVINGDTFTFYRGGKPVQARYASDGHEVLTYKKGNRGVRYIFKKTAGDAAAPMFVQFSDHAIAPVKAGHYHIYSGDDRAALLKEVTNWPTYYPAGLTADDIVKEMLAH
ncbi:MAG: metal-binding protein ZinT [Alphaproteobacteria bacterium]|nr:metal-binding protein ZinT [Alphaproteobacteria bacterium]MCC0035214.1 metal-binding protein ZinT [Hoeflea sp.]